MVTTPGAELAARAGRVRLVLTDCDGVLTDAGVYVSPGGEELKRFSIRDGMGVERLRDAGIAVAIVTGERSEIVRRRSEKLGLPHLWLGVKDKRALLGTIVAESGCQPGELAYIGDDVNDLGLLRVLGETGLVGAPSDAVAEVRQVVHHVCAQPGGHGAFREFADWILALRNERRKS